jgi:hypothetical protein
MNLGGAIPTSGMRSLRAGAGGLGAAIDRVVVLALPVAIA